MKLSRRGCRAVLLPIATLVAATTVLSAVATTPVGAVTRKGVVTIGKGSGQFTSGQSVSVKVSANTVFTPNLHVNILECADPGGKAANLPRSVNDCDGITIQANTVLINADGSVNEHTYTLMRLPAINLGESKRGQPICNGTHQCVLYVGQNQENFNDPKVFSRPFTVR